MESKETYGSPMNGKSVTVAYSGTAGTTVALDKATKTIRIMSTTDCFIEIGLNPTAVVNTGMYLTAYSPEYFQGDAGIKVSAIQVNTAGSLYVTPV